MLYVYSGRLVELDGGKLHPVTEPRLLCELTRIIRFVRMTKKGELVAAKPAEGLARQILSLLAYPGVPPLRAVVSHPVLDLSGSYSVRQGYDAPSKLYIESQWKETFPTEPPSAEEAREHLQTLLALIEGFPFDSEASRAGALALLITGLMRPVLEGPVPLFLVDAADPATGKSLLARVIGILITGREPCPGTFPRRPEEQRKRITAYLVQGERYIFFDNVEHSVGGEVLNALATGVRWSDRELQRTKILELENYSIVVFTGNNLCSAADTLRRVIPIRMVARCERPDKRKGFKIEPLERHVKENRAKYVNAALELTRAYLHTSDVVTLSAMGSFEGWSDVVRAAIYWAGGGDCLGGAERFRELHEDERDDIRALLRAWEAGFGVDAPVYARQALEKLSGMKGRPLEEFTLGSKESISVRDISNLLRRIKDRVVGGLFLTSGRKTKHGIPWTLRRVTSPMSPPEAGPS